MQRSKIALDIERGEFYDKVDASAETTIQESSVESLLLTCRNTSLTTVSEYLEYNYAEARVVKVPTIEAEMELEAFLEEYNRKYN